MKRQSLWVFYIASLAFCILETINGLTGLSGTNKLLRDGHPLRAVVTSNEQSFNKRGHDVTVLYVAPDGLKRSLVKHLPAGVDDWSVGSIVSVQCSGASDGQCTLDPAYDAYYYGMMLGIGVTSGFFSLAFAVLLLQQWRATLKRQSLWALYIASLAFCILETINGLTGLSGTNKLLKDGHPLRAVVTSNEQSFNKRGHEVTVQYEAPDGVKRSLVKHFPAGVDDWSVGSIVSVQCSGASDGQCTLDPAYDAYYYGMMLGLGATSGFLSSAFAALLLEQWRATKRRGLPE